MPERDNNGRFVKGNKASPGRAPRQQEADYLRMTIEAVTPDYWLAVVRRAIGDAIKGDGKARDWLGNYVIGKPPQILELRAGEAMLLAKLLEQFKAHGLSASEAFELMFQELASVEAESEDDE